MFTFVSHVVCYVHAQALLESDKISWGNRVLPSTDLIPGNYVHDFLWRIILTWSDFHSIISGVQSQQKVHFGPRPVAQHPGTFLASRLATKHTSRPDAQQDHREGCSQMSSVLASQCWRLVRAGLRRPAINASAILARSALHCQNFQINPHRDRRESRNFPLPLHQLAGFWRSSVPRQFPGVSAGREGLW